MSTEHGSGNDGLTELELELADRSYPIVRLAIELDAEARMLETIRVDDSTVLGYLSVRSDAAERLRELGSNSDRVERFAVLAAADDDCLCQVELRDCIAHSLTDNGIVVTSARAEDGALRIVGIVPPGADPAEVVASVRATHPELELVSKRERDASTTTFLEHRFRTVLRERLTGRQFQALYLAHVNDYFDDPRHVTQSELAAELDVSQETFSHHLRRAQHRLLTALFESGCSPSTIG